MGSFREHGVLIYLSKELYLGFIKLQADRGLGRSYAGLLPFAEGLYRLGYISKDVYEEHVRKYSQPLNADVPLTIQQLGQKAILERKDRQFKGQLDQWEEHSSVEWRKKVLADAEKYRDKLESARLLLKKKEPEEDFE